MKKSLKCTLIVMALLGMIIPGSAMAWWGAGHHHYRHHIGWHHGPYNNCGHRWTCFYHKGHRVCKHMNVCHTDRSAFYHRW